MTKTKRQPIAPLEKLHKHFSTTARWGSRWHESLFIALAGSTQYTTLRNKQAPSKDFELVMHDMSGLKRVVLPSCRRDENSQHITCYTNMTTDGDGLSRSSPFPEAIKSSNGLNTHWNLDLASLLPVCALDVQHNEKVLDICAAPGGKSVALAQNVFPETLLPNSPSSGCLHSNEAHLGRMKRLDENLRQYIPEVYRATKQSVCLHSDAASSSVVFPQGIAGYDKVLLDAPCSSERHILHAQERASRSSSTKICDELLRWSPTMTKRLAETQLKLLQTAFRSVRVGGRVVYATCSISKEENDEVVESAIRWSVLQQSRKATTWSCQQDILSTEYEHELLKWAERTDAGWIVLPDHQTPYGTGWGPLYFAILTKVNKS